MQRPNRALVLMLLGLVAATGAAAKRGQAPGADAAAPAAADAAALGKRIFTPIGVRKKGTTDRLMINHADGLKAILAEHDGRAFVTFDHAVRINIAHVNEVLPAMFAPLAETPDGRGFSFALPAGRHISQDKDANFLVIEIPQADPNASPPPAVSAAIPPAAVAQPVTKPESKPAPQPTAIAAAPPAPPKAAAEIPSPAPVKPIAEQPLAAAPPPPTPDPAKMATIGHGGGHGEEVRYADIGDGASVRFEWSTPVAAAVFDWGGVVWVVFDRPENFVFDAKPKTKLRGLTAISQIPNASASVMRLTVEPQIAATVRRAGNAWVLDLRPQAMPLGAPIEPVIHRDGDAAVSLSALQPAPKLQIVDPDSSENLIVIPLPQLGQGIGQAREFADFRLLATSQGVVVKPIADQLTVAESPTEITISAPGGLSLSADDDAKPPAAAPKLNGTLMQPADWVGKADASFDSKNNALLQRIVTAEDADKTAARVAYARFLFANAMAPEALGVLRATAHDVPNLLDDPAVRLLQGAAEEMSGKLDLAAADLNDAALDGRVDTALWRAELAADQENWKNAATLGKQGMPELAAYPPTLRRRLSLPLADAMFWAGDRDAAETLAADVLASDPSQGERDYAQCLEGRLAANRNEIEKATSLWEGVAKSPDIDLGRAEANYALVITAFEKGKLMRTDAITEIDRLRFAWRGDGFEVRVLRKLADLYAADGNYRMAFESLQEVTLAFPDSPAARDATAQMQRIFAQIFSGPDAATMAPLTSLALYEQFKELTPAGAEGDQIIRKLADRLVAVDLLDRAGSLLDDQVRNRLSGVDQARIGAQAALVRLMDHRPADAVAVLDLPTTGDLPEDLARQRAELKARADSELGKPDDALALLASDTSADANGLRDEIYLKTQQWPQLAAALAQSLPTPDSGAPLSDADAGTIVRIATAMTLGQDKAGLAALQKRYGPRMDETKARDDFRVVAGDSTGQPDADRHKLADRVAQIGDLQSFMNQYRQRVQQSSLSSIN